MVKMENKKGQFNPNNPIGTILAIFVFIMVGIMTVSVVSQVSNTITEDQCKPYQEQKEQCEKNLNSCLEELNQTKSYLNKCEDNYKDLKNNTITKKDFEEVKRYFKLTQNEVKTINKKIDSIDRIYNFYNIKNYSFALNIILGIEILSFIFLRSEFLQWIWSISLGKNKNKKENKHEEKKGS